MNKPNDDTLKDMIEWFEKNHSAAWSESCYEALRELQHLRSLHTSAEIPPLEVTGNSNNGVEIRAVLPDDARNCAEFVLRKDVPQSILIAPWIQFEPTKLHDYRLKLAYEIARRATVHEALIKKIDEREQRLKSQMDAYDKKVRVINAAFNMWRKERAAHGLPEDFSDVKVWPRELMGDY